MSKDSRSGKKYGGSHTSLIPLAAVICDIAHQSPSVTKISPGFIKAGLKSVGGQRRIKIASDKTHILLSIRDNASHQEVRVYADDVEAVKLMIAQGARSEGIQITLSKNRDYN
jgi:hypothetical protein